MRAHGLRDNVALLVLLERRGAAPDQAVPEQEEPVLLVGNTHLLFNPKRGDIKARGSIPVLFFGQAACFDHG